LNVYRETARNFKTDSLLTNMNTYWIYNYL
jgi:hypothetical protein